jgi:hypothetical protein
MGTGPKEEAKRKVERPTKVKNYNFEIQTKSGGRVNTYARGTDVDNAKFYLYKQYPGCLVISAQKCRYVINDDQILRPLPSEVRRRSSRHPRNPRRHSDHVRPATGDADDAQLSAIRRCFTNGRVRYSMETIYVAQMAV